MLNKYKKNNAIGFMTSWSKVDDLVACFFAFGVLSAVMRDVQYSILEFVSCKLHVTTVFLTHPILHQKYSQDPHSSLPTRQNNFIAP